MNAVLPAVVCNTVTSCLAVGSFESGVTTKTLAERWNGSTWQIVGSPNRTGAQSTILSGVACVSAANCFAVGLGAMSGTPASFALRWNEQRGPDLRAVVLPSSCRQTSPGILLHECRNVCGRS